MSFCDHADFRAMAVARATTRFTMVSLLERSHFWGSRRLVMILDIRAIQKSRAKSKPMLFLNHLEQACPNAQLRPTDGTLRAATALAPRGYSAISRHSHAPENYRHRVP
ncbi:hypothetical protein [Acetobacter okinawensis]|uniref:hypothetical protein n=1 Tax=Acetobacter okinawensis TaxID=1076594 RepID=UPI00046E5AF1|nr:hypothetical protein [Acetobacter okinawensis]